MQAMFHEAISGEEMIVVEVNANAIGIPFACMMENAGSETARVIISRTDADAKVAIVCGTGNNGGDGFATARHLLAKSDYITVEVFLVGGVENIRKDDSRLNWEILQKIHSPRLKIHPAMDVEKMDFSGFGAIVDAVFGTGLKGSVREPFATAIRKINECKGTVRIFSIDVPSGMDATSGTVLGTAVTADCTISLHRVKKGLIGNPNAGEVLVADIGIPATSD